ncbi:hypothetical protein HZH66_003465 [Vespula vulgaris]|uniref:Uncharacterized protein n=1 Tax=Vespula vulgaris TaxID=7454 RepID=A0A836UM54_VESVU|nr:hypothetical protein HZH66_003465 [Vespula vulgaris]
MRHRQDSRTFTATPVDAPPWLERNAGSRQARQLGRSGGSKSNPIGAQNVAHAHPGIEATEAQRQRRTSRRVPQLFSKETAVKRKDRRQKEIITFLYRYSYVAFPSLKVKLGEHDRKNGQGVEESKSNKGGERRTKSPFGMFDSKDNFFELSWNKKRNKDYEGRRSSERFMHRY